MFAGHVGAALAIGSAERRVNAGVFVAAALLLDFLLWILVLAGVESVLIPADFAATHQARFAFPYSHGLASSLAWSALAGLLAWRVCRHAPEARRRIAVLVAAAVGSHWLLDALVHQPELPLLGLQSAQLGLGLWRNIPLALAVETAITIGGLLLYLAGGNRTRGRSVALAALSIVVLAFTILGMSVAPPPPSAQAMAGASLATLAAVCALYAWLGRAPPLHRSR